MELASCEATTEDRTNKSLPPVTTAAAVSSHVVSSARTFMVSSPGTLGCPPRRSPGRSAPDSAADFPPPFVVADRSRPPLFHLRILALGGISDMPGESELGSSRAGSSSGIQLPRVLIGHRHFTPPASGCTPHSFSRPGSRGVAIDVLPTGAMVTGRGQLQVLSSAFQLDDVLNASLSQGSLSYNRLRGR